MPNKTPTKKASKAAIRYNYEELQKISTASAKECHFYGVITDATFPYKVRGGDKDRFIVTLRVIDPSLPKKSAQVILYASRFEDLPIIHRIGDIIRIHRANLRMYHGERQFNVNVYYKSSWALYSTDKQTPLGGTASGPYAFSGSRATEEKQDAVIFSTLQKWANSQFAANAIADGGKTVQLKAAAKAQGDFDVVAKILQVFELDEYTNELKLRDASGTVYYTLALKLKFPHLRQGAVVRIRSASHDETSTGKNVLVLQHYSNIMTFLGSSKLATQVSKVGNDNSAEKAALKSKCSMVPVVATEVDKKHQGLANTSLHDLFHSPDNSKSTFRTCFYVTRVDCGGSNAEAVQIYNKASKKFSSAKGGKGDLAYRVQFLCKDVSTQFNNNVYRILLYTHEGLGSSFLPKATNLHTDKDGCKKLGATFDTLTSFNSWVDAVVERRNGYYFIKDTKMIF